MPDWLWYTLIIFVFLAVLAAYVWLRTVDEVGQSGAWMMFV
ncbi:hypothetical protein QKT49_gp280 [Acanthamoeba castellanii medusavirus]|uniref:Uncharacterized protein n=1 Tax=Acanthamoeba castellanii medusavirus J1 TaxID=3114988 RepID=A0A3T1CXD0_9VIRU|nr:hypothetical protein QKT49_gp280 [Acanthamoeba castellanii medusavirus]BBI30483.1 hypothetical protein [Acanthamoeba castellanii medusavirus J1]